MAEKRPPRVMGGDHDRFWDWCNRGKLAIQRCRDCGHRPWPVIEACEECGGVLEFEPVSGRGRLVSWCRFHQPYYGDLMPTPYDTIVVALEEGPYFISNPHGFSTAEATDGMPVSLAFIDCEDEHGAYRLPVFEKA
ncbi:MAG: OB-fold domain-containing protein [Novosphingobium sp.]|nr:OB-fold domain-containing protein [Novosphingobium sp.]